jgi:phosphoenolpyruvate phosphomutase
MLARKIINDDTIVSYGDVIFDENILLPLINFKGLIGLGIDFDWEKNYEGQGKELKLEATVAQVRNQICTKIVDGRELKSKDQAILEITDSKNEKLGEFVGLMKLSKQGGKIFTEKYEKLIKTSTGPFHEANSLDDAYFTDMLQELIESNVDITPISVKGKWCEIDTVQDLKRAEEMF